MGSFIFYKYSKCWGKLYSWSFICKKNTSVTKNPVIDHSKGDHRYADVVKFGDKHKNKHVGDHSYACTVEESGALHNKNNEKSIIPNPQIE